MEFLKQGFKEVGLAAFINYFESFILYVGIISL